MWVYFLAGLLSLMMARVVDEVSGEIWWEKEGDLVYLYWEYLGVMERMRVKRSSSWAFSRSKAFLCIFRKHSRAYKGERYSRTYSDVPFS